MDGRCYDRGGAGSARRLTNTKLLQYVLQQHKTLPATDTAAGDGGGGAYEIGIGDRECHYVQEYMNGKVRTTRVFI